MTNLKMEKSRLGASRYDVRIGGGRKGGSWKSRHSKGGCVAFIQQISSKCRHEERESKTLKILQMSYLEAPVSYIAKTQLPPTVTASISWAYTMMYTCEAKRSKKAVPLPPSTAADCMSRVLLQAITEDPLRCLRLCRWRPPPRPPSPALRLQPLSCFPERQMKYCSGY